MHKRKFFPLIVGIILLSLSCFTTVFSSPSHTLNDKWSTNFRPYGAYVDEILFLIHGSSDSAMSALHSGEIDAYDDRVPPEFVPDLMMNPNIEVKSSPSTFFRQLSLNCGRFPTNITGYRRAMAFGLDKYQNNEQAIEGRGYPLDSYIPLSATEWEIESSLNEHFYESDLMSGKEALENAGFVDLDGDGWREYDVNGNNIWDIGVDLDDSDCAINFDATAGYDPAIIACNLARDGLQAMGMRATVIEKGFNELINDAFNGDYWVICFSWGIDLNDPVDLLRTCFQTGGEYADTLYYFSNSTIDAAIEAVYDATTIEDAKVAAADALELLVFEQPMIVCYNDVLIDAYRTDKFEGYFLANGLGYSNGLNPYVGIKVRQKETNGENQGGTFHYCMSSNLETSNVVMVAERHTQTVMNYIYESLWQIDPETWDPIPQLAYDWTIEQMEGGVANPGQKFTFYLHEHNVWHDEKPITSEDVKYSFETIWPTNPLINNELDNIYMINCPDSYTVEIYVDQSGYLEFPHSTGFFVLPKHIWEAHEGTFDTWVPTNHDMIGSGPYMWNEHASGEYISLLKYENWRKGTALIPILDTPGFSSFIVLLGLFGMIMVVKSVRKKD